MENLADLNDGDLLDLIGDYAVSDINLLRRAVLQVTARIRRHSVLRNKDRATICNLIALARRMYHRDLDMSHQSLRVSRLGGEYLVLKTHLLARMSGQQCAICATT